MNNSSQDSSESDNDSGQTTSNYNYSSYHLDRDTIQSIVEERPINIEHYCQAFVHKSIQKYTKNSSTSLNYTKQSYERFEYLGDSILNFIVADYLFKKYPNKNEGFLTRIRTKLVNGRTLAKLARSLDLGKYILLSSNVNKINGRENDRILEDIFEALVCAIYLDLGFKKASNFVIRIIEKNINFSELEYDDNYKDILLRFCQHNMGTTPTYETVECYGPPHKRDFKVVCFIQNIQYKYGIGKSKKIAEQLAAKETLIGFGVKL